MISALLVLLAVFSQAVTAQRTWFRYDVHSGADCSEASFVSGGWVATGVFDPVGNNTVPPFSCQRINTGLGISYYFIDCEDWANGNVGLVLCGSPGCQASCSRSTFSNSSCNNFGFLAYYITGACEVNYPGQEPPPVPPQLAEEGVFVTEDSSGSNCADTTPVALRYWYRNTACMSVNGRGFHRSCNATGYATQQNCTYLGPTSCGNCGPLEPVPTSDCTVFAGDNLTRVAQCSNIPPPPTVAPSSAPTGSPTPAPPTEAPTTAVPTAAPTTVAPTTVAPTTVPPSTTVAAAGTTVPPSPTSQGARFSLALYLVFIVSLLVMQL